MLTEYLAPNLVAEAARDFGVNDDRARLAITQAALLEGRRVGDWSIAAEAAARAAGLDSEALLALARSPGIEARARATTAEFHALSVTQRPAFLLENLTGDRVVFSGLATVDPLISSIDALLADEAAHLAYAAHHGPPPKG